MNKKAFHRAWEIASAALDLEASQRQELIEKACDGDPDMRHEVESLLEHCAETNPDASPVIDMGSIPERIAHFSIVRKVGEGGMGVVYEAIQDTPNRRVALKLMRSGHLSPKLLRRFEYEIEVMASLEHPGIAHVYDAGVFDIGGGSQPYFAMEFVEGGALDDYVERCNSSKNERLELFVKICDAVHHAHQKGIIHRDLKPDNVLVTATGEPKVLDFGVSRAIGEQAEDLTMLTDVGRIVGTLAYMSPEQVQGRRDELTVSSDVWSLGVIAYELLTGSLPFEVQGQSLAAAARTIVDKEPTPLGKRDRSLRGDLEIVVSTALQKDPAYRYHSAAELAADLRRVIASQPIVARSPSTFYRIRKFARRNRALTFTAAALLATLAFSFASTVYQNLLLDRSISELRRLADGHIIDELNNEFPHLPAAGEEDAVVLAAWHARASEVVARQALHRRTLAALRQRSLPYSLADHERHRRQHPQWSERQRIAYLLEFQKGQLEAAPREATRREVENLELRATEIDAEIDASRSWHFANPTDQWAHDTLVAVIDKCALFAESEHGPFTKVGEWLDLVPKLRTITIEDQASKWDQAIANIANEELSPWYRGLEIEAQPGLIPLGRDPKSGLWEFGHPQTGSLPRRGSDGSLILAEDFGLVFVLLPGGRFRMGAERPSARRPLGTPNVDANATAIESPIHELNLDAFLISKFEMTKAQWERFSGRQDGQHRTSTLHGESFSPRDPIETVHWVNCDELTRALGLTIPTEAQWEYAARGRAEDRREGLDPIEALRGGVNLYDRTYMQAQPVPESEDPVAWSFDDGAVHVTAVGSYSPNSFGLHDMLGNVEEWCLDTPTGYSMPPAAGTGLRRGGMVDFRMRRGGSYSTPPRQTRIPRRERAGKWTNVGNIGLRPARAIR